jgi:uncharacterized damage-inducible protein DinB
MQATIVYFYLLINCCLNPRLQQLYESLEAQRHQLMDSLKNLSFEKLNHQPEGKWSINQIIAHLITAEKMSVMYLTKKIQGVNEVENSGLFEELKMMGLIVSQRLPFKFKAPRVVVENTSASTSLKQLEQEWNSVRDETKTLLEKIKDDQVKRMIYKHVRAGKLNIQHALIFFREHVIHHKPQIKRLQS